MKKCCPLLLLITWILAALLVHSGAFAGGRVEHHYITSKILANAGEIADRELSVYLPEEYDTSELAYPVLYLLHGGGGTNRTFLGAGYSGVMSGVHVNKIVDKLIGNGEINSLIVVLPHMLRSVSLIPNYSDYFIQEVIPLVDMTYRTIPNRNGRAITGHSRGGYDSFAIALLQPDMFSLVGGYAAGSKTDSMPGREMFENYNQQLYPLHFWIYVGKNDQFNLAPGNREFVEILKEIGVPHVYFEDDGDHFNRITQRLEESIVFFSQNLSSPTASVELNSKLTTTWSKIKSNK